MNNNFESKIKTVTENESMISIDEELMLDSKRSEEDAELDNLAADNLSIFTKKDYKYIEIIWTELVEEEILDDDMEMQIDIALDENLLNKSPLFYVDLFLDDYFYEYISKQSKKYYYKKAKVINDMNDYNKIYLLEKQYIKIYLLVVISMGLVDLPSYKLFWNKHLLFENLFVKNLLSKHEYEFIVRY